MDFITRGTLTIIFAIAIFFSMNCNGSDDPVAMPGENEVWMQNDFFNPNSLTIEPGTTITWTNKGNMAHTTTSNDGLWDSGIMNPGATFTHTFQDEGTYHYLCTLHPLTMTGVIIVAD
jgi:plastocyanin